MKKFLQFILIIGLFGACFILIKSEYFKKEEKITYINVKEKGVSLYVPSNWQRIEQDENIISYSGTESNSNFGVKIASVGEVSHISLEELTKASADITTGRAVLKRQIIEENFGKNMNLTVTKPEYDKIGENHGSIVKFTYDTKLKGNELTNITEVQYLMKKGSSFYEVTFVLKSEDLEKYQYIIDKMVDTISI